MSSAELLDQLFRLHDQDPAAAAGQLPALLDAPDLTASEQSRLSWLVNHVQGELLQDWAQAWRLQQRLSAGDAPLAVLRNAAVAAAFAGDMLSGWVLERRMQGGASEMATSLAVRLGVLQGLSGREPPRRIAQGLLSLLPGLESVAAGSLDTLLAAACNNVVSALLEHEQLDAGDADSRAALQEGARTARLLWGRAGSWVNHERADYLMALVGNRLSLWEQALQAALSGLSLIDANGEEKVDRAFLLLQQAQACRKLGLLEQAQKTRREAGALAQDFDVELRAWFDDCARRADA